MKTVSLFGFILLLIVVFSACQKTPVANFNFDKIEYISGDTVFLTNKSTDAFSYEWTMPNGITQTTTNTFYIIPNNSGFSSLSFSLKAYSKNGKKNSIAHNSVNTIPQSSFSIDGIQTYYPLIITSNIWPQGPAYWNVTAKCRNSNDLITFTLTDYPTTNPLNLKLINGWNLNASYWANFQVQLGKHGLYDSDSGKLYTEILNGKLHLKMDSVYEPIYKVKISANIYCH